MYISEDKYTSYWDCDDTLVMWHKPGSEEMYTSFDEGAIAIDNYGEIYVMPHWKHIQALKEFSARKQVVIVWSAGGSSWAAKVVRALKLERYVDAVLTKPHVYFDDLDCKAFMGDRKYID